MIDSTEALTDALATRRATAGPGVGFVPTMGALHAGHTALVAAARADCDTVVLSAYVNPAQFGPGEDLEAYPRDPEGDLATAAAAGVDILFVPGTYEMYPELAAGGASAATPAPSAAPANAATPAPPTAPSVVGRLGEVWEGAARPGHLEGVATVVAKLFGLVGSCRAYFGEKDYQQLLVVRRLAAGQAIPVEIVGCPTVREPDGLAMSSRNARLRPPERRAAAVLYKALLAGRKAVEAGRCEAQAVRQLIEEIVRQEPLARLDYAAVTAACDLMPAPTPLQGELRLLVAAKLGDVRLIDNLGVRVP